MKKSILFTSILLLFCAASFWAGSQHGQRQNWLLMSAADAMSAYNKLTTKPFDESEELSEREKLRLESEIDRLIIRYGGYVSSGHSFYHGKLDKSFSIHVLFEKPIKYRLANPRMSYSPEAKKAYLQYYESEYQKDIGRGVPGSHEEYRDMRIRKLLFTYAALDVYANE